MKRLIRKAETTLQYIEKKKEETGLELPHNIVSYMTSNNFTSDKIDFMFNNANKLNEDQLMETANGFAKFNLTMEQSNFIAGYPNFTADQMSAFIERVFYTNPLTIEQVKIIADLNSTKEIMKSFATYVKDYGVTTEQLKYIIDSFTTENIADEKVLDFSNGLTIEQVKEKSKNGKYN